MNARVQELYDKSLEDKEFLDDIKRADEDNKPSIFARKSEKISFATMYYGWLVGRYKDDWRAKGGFPTYF